MAATPNIFSVSPSTPFLQATVEALLSGQLIPGFQADDDPMALADVTIYVPTRRAARTLPDVLRKALGAKAALLPKILPLGDVDEEEHILKGHGDGEALPPAMSTMERKLAMTRLVWAWKGQLRRQILQLKEDDPARVPASSADAAWLAGNLLTLMDEVQTEEASWAELGSLVPDDHAEYWKITLEFLKIVTDLWPEHLKTIGMMDPKERRSALIRAEAARLRTTPPRGPVIVAGATGSFPATAELMKAVLSLENGALVLPALDRGMDAESWEALGSPSERQRVPGHPQYSLRQLLLALGVKREDVTQLGAPESEALRLRCEIVNEALRPAETTEEWQDFFTSELAEHRETAFAGTQLITARNEAEEALSIALLLREAVEAGKTTALISPDRTLARRVASELTRWGIIVDDTAGRPLEQTPPMVLAILTAKLALQGLDPVNLLALLKHPLAFLGMKAKEVRSAARALERGVLRGPHPRPGLSGLREAVEAAHDQAMEKADRPVARWRKLVEEDWDAINTLLDRLEQALGPLEALLQNPNEIPVEELIKTHVDAVLLLGADENGSTEELFRGENGKALAETLTSLLEADAAGLCVPANEWPGVFGALITGGAVRSRTPADPRIHLLGPMEARLQRYDLVVLGGLNEGTWPQRTRNDPWLNRPMKGQIGLDPPERKIGTSAHDFLWNLGAPEVVLSRSERVDGSPTVASRWLQRIVTLAGQSVEQQMRAKGKRYTEMAHVLDRSETPVRPAKRPEPKPPVEARPVQLSVTAIENLIRDPYLIYARHVLKLDEVDPIGGEPGAADKGNIIHDALANFLEDWDGPFDEKAVRALLTEGGRLFRPLDAFPAIRALWWPRFERIAEEFVAYEGEVAPKIYDRFLEEYGKVEMPRPERNFTLTGRADRIDQMKDNTLRVVDYKTGQPPSAKQVEALLSPQLPLEVAMIRRKGFEDLPHDMPISDMLYIQLKGGSDAVKLESRVPKESTAEELSEEAWKRLEQLVAAYENPRKGYLSRARVLKEREWAASYDHLARVQEWSLGEDGEDA
ncbi:double-strand break repair protein AddB [Pseudovibrio denitrificans]|uniref:double-strand break repair protein AddB n=1 Tax=Pseudovibrio denitrificans TaxID=258256 RepID=UPI0039BFBF38